MKKVFRLLTLFVVVGSMVALTSCGKDKQAQIVGKWQFVKASVSVSLSDPELQEYINQFISYQEAELNNDLETAMFEFKSDNTFVAYYDGEAESTGNWSLENNKLILSSIEEGESISEEFNIPTLNSSTLIMEAVESYDDEDEVITGTISTTLEFKRV